MKETHEALLRPLFDFPFILFVITFSHILLSLGGASRSPCEWPLAIQVAIHNPYNEAIHNSALAPTPTNSNSNSNTNTNTNTNS